VQQNDLQFVGTGEEEQQQEPKKEVIAPEVLEDMLNIWSVFDLESKD